MTSIWDEDPHLRAEAERHRQRYEEHQRQRANGHDTDAAPAVVHFASGGNFTMEKVSWIWPGWLARGKLHILGGQKGAGKSTLAFDLFAQLTAGGKFPDGSPAPIGDVLIWSAEDDVEDTILPRMVAAGADRDRIHFITGTTLNGKRRAFDPATDMQALVASSQQFPDLTGMLLDPVALAMVGDSHKNAETRRGLQPVVDFIVERNLLGLGITHFTKNTAGRDPIERITGSLAFGAIPRIVLAAAKGDTEEAPRRLVRIASNIGPSGGGYEYLLRQDLLPDHDFQAQRVVWTRRLEGSPLELLEPGETRKSKQKKAAELLAELLAGGPVPVAEIREAAIANGISWPTIERAKSDDKTIVAKKAGKGWAWVKEAAAAPHWAAE